MASRNSAALFIILNLIFFFLMASSCDCHSTQKHKLRRKKHSPKPCPPKPCPPPPPKPCPPKKHTPKPCPPKKHTPKPCPPPPPKPCPPKKHTPKPCLPPKKHSPKPCPPKISSTIPSFYGTCPIDTLKLGVCANVLNGLIDIVIDAPPKKLCCSLIEGLADLEAAVCLCTAIKANVLGIHLKIPISLSLLFNYCGKNIPTGFQCP